MKRLLAALLPLLVLPPAAAWEVPGPGVLAEGKVHLTLRDALTGEVLCRRSALVVVEISVQGEVAWHAPGCEGPRASGLQGFGYWCPDACVPLCHVTEAEAGCGRESWTLFDRFTLGRGGAFQYVGVPTEGVVLEMEGRLVVATWPVFLG